MSDVIISKKAGEKLALAMDFSAWMGDTAVINTVNAITAIACNGTASSDVTITAQAVSGQSVNFFAEGGEAGIRYEIRVSIITSEGEILIGDGILAVT